MEVPGLHRGAARRADPLQLDWQGVTAATMSRPVQVGTRPLDPGLRLPRRAAAAMRLWSGSAKLSSMALTSVFTDVTAADFGEVIRRGGCEE